MKAKEGQLFLTRKLISAFMMGYRNVSLIMLLLLQGGAPNPCFNPTRDVVSVGKDP